MSTDLSKSDEVNDSLDSILNMDEGEDNILGQTFIGDLLDKDDGADIGGNQSDTQSATEEGTREQPHSATFQKPAPRSQHHVPLQSLASISPGVKVAVSS